MTAISFQARARTVDHLGREQIADCPTAISELWKNAYDAYARNVALDIYAIPDEPTVAVLRDDGHGMDYDDFVNKWLVIGTESKAGNDTIKPAQRLGLAPRQKLGQKGIGRLSSANLGPLLLVVSKKVKSTCVCSLIDWRIFENPFLNLSDIEIPVIPLKKSKDVYDNLDGMFLTLINNIAPDVQDEDISETDKERRKRVLSAWKRYDEQALSEGKAQPSKLILNTLHSRPFKHTHLEGWPSNVEGEKCGTLMLVSEVNFDLEVIANSSLNDMAAEKARSRFIETLVNSVDPYGVVGVSGVVAKVPDFDYKVTVTKKLDEASKQIIIPGKNGFDRSDISFAEHQVDGVVDENGVFTGRIRAFGVWFEDRLIKPPTNLKINSRENTKVGKFGIYIAASEQRRNSSTLNDAEFERFNHLLEKNSGFLIFRDGLRVMPYGRTDNDFFDIEYRRSKNAGVAYYADRRMFGRIALSRNNNPNLKDKAGREGFLDNQAAKIFKEIVINLLIQTANQYFGGKSKIRKSNLSDIKRKNANAKAEAERRELARKLKKELKGNLKKFTPKLIQLSKQVTKSLEEFHVGSDNDVSRVKIEIESYNLKLSKLVLYSEVSLPKSLELPYREYRSKLSEAEAVIEEYDNQLKKAIANLKLKDPSRLLKEQAKRNTFEHQQFLDRAQGKSNDQIESERVRLADIRATRRDILTEDNRLIIERFQANQIDYIRASKEIDEVFQEQFATSKEIYESYLRALDALKSGLDLDYLIRFNMAKSESLLQDVDKLTGLAQLGIAVEITGHEIHDYRSLVAEAMSRLPDASRKTKAFNDIDLAIQGMTEQMKFLSPLRLSGQQIRVPISGLDIHDYLYDFFKVKLGSLKASLEFTQEFAEFEIQEFRSRIFPVFINLVNNSIYWTSQNQEDNERKIKLAIVNNEVVISDNGPGVDPVDFDDLFTLFFSRREHTGRGVGLYLARASLAAGGHSIRYVPDPVGMPLQGANFAIKFLGSNLSNG